MYYDKKILEYCRNQSTLTGAIKKIYKTLQYKDKLSHINWIEGCQMWHTSKQGMAQKNKIK